MERSKESSRTERLGPEARSREQGQKKGKQPVFLKKKNPKKLGMQRQFSSTL